MLAGMALEVPPSTRLGTKDELREQLGVSVATVSEALRLLEARGMVRLRTGPGGGVFATEPSGKLLLSNLVLGFRGGAMAVRDVLDTREALEPVLGRAAALRRSANDLRQLRKIIREMQVHLEEPETYLRLNWRLHRRIAESTRNEVLAQIYCSLVRFLEEELTQAMVDASRKQRLVANLELHSELVEAIAARDEDRAAKLAAHHAPASIRDASNRLNDAAKHSRKARSNGSK